MEAEKLLEQNGFSKFYESKNVVGFASIEIEVTRCQNINQ